MIYQWDIDCLCSQMHRNTWKSWYHWHTYHHSDRGYLHIGWLLSHNQYCNKCVYCFVVLISIQFILHIEHAQCLSWLYLFDRSVPSSQVHTDRCNSWYRWNTLHHWNTVYSDSCQLLYTRQHFVSTLLRIQTWWLSVVIVGKHYTDLSDSWNPCSQERIHMCRMSPRLHMYHHSDMDCFDMHQPLQWQSCQATANQNEVVEQEEPIRFHRLSHVTYFLISNQVIDGS